jgi:hypothetical protein
MTRRRHARGICPVCREDIPLRTNGRPFMHGPRANRCTASYPDAGDVPQHSWDRSAGRRSVPADRPFGWKPSVDERIANGAAVANIAAHNFTNQQRAS